MPLEDIISLLGVDTTLVTGTTSFIFIIAVLLMTIIQVAPIKINPWDFVLGWIGDRTNSHIIKKVDGLDQKLTDHILESREGSLKRKRLRIISFVEDGVNGKKYTKEAFENMIRECDDYEKFIKETGMPNGVIEASIDVIRARYKEHLNKADFAEYPDMRSECKEEEESSIK